MRALLLACSVLVVAGSRTFDRGAATSLGSPERRVLAIYDPSGNTVGWLQNTTVYDLNGHFRAFIYFGAVYSYGGKHLGALDHGFFRDLSGDCVAFMSGASGGPDTPLPQFEPAPPPLPAAPTPHIPPTRALVPIGSLEWSTETWDEFLRE